MRKEIGYAKAANLNAIRLTLHWVPFAVDPIAFLHQLEKTASMTAAVGCRLLLVEPEGCLNRVEFTADVIGCDGTVTTPGLESFGALCPAGFELSGGA